MTLGHFALLVLAISLAITVLTACGGGGLVQSVNKALIFGDSITANGNPPSGNLIGTLAGIPIENLATGSEVVQNAITGEPVRTADGGVFPLKYTTFAEKIKTTDANIIILRYGGGDALLSTPPETFFSQISTLLNICSDYNKKVLLVGVSGISGIYQHTEAAKLAEANNSILKLTATARRIPFVNVRDLSYTNEDFVDGLHPTQEYSDRMAAYIADALKKHYLS